MTQEEKGELIILGGLVLAMIVFWYGILLG
jgi:hypothetical protein